MNARQIRLAIFMSALASFAGAQAATNSVFAVAAADPSLVPVLVRWAQTDGLVVLLDGRRVTTKSLREAPYLDLPLTPEARSATGATAEEAIDAALKTYRSYQSDVEVSAAFKPPYFLAITTKRTTPLVASVAPPKSPQTSRQTPPTPQVPSQRASAPKRVSPPPASGNTNTAAAVVPYPTWDAAARRSAGVMPGIWLVGESRSLRAVVEAWAQQSGHQLEWTSKHDHPLTDAIRASHYRGTFRDALKRLAVAMGQLDKPLGMSFAQNGGRPVLRVFDL